MSKERYAILIGINDIEENGLIYCVKDVNDFADVLESFCLFKRKNIFKIISEKKQENLDVHVELENIIDSLINTYKIDSDDLLLIYYSGHGKFDTKKQESLLRFPKYDLSTQKIKEYVDKLHPKHSIIIFDACFAGAKIFSKSFNLNKLKRKLHVDSDSVFGIYGSTTELEAYQIDKLKNSLFTHHLIETIKNEKNYDEDGFLSIDSLASICSKKVYQHSYKLKTEKEQVITREGRIEGFLPFAEISFKKNKSETKDQFIPSTEQKSSELKRTNKIQRIPFKEEILRSDVLLSKVKDNIRNFKPVIASMILGNNFDKPYNPPLELFRGEIEEAVRKNILDEDDINYYNPLVKSLKNILDLFIDFITDIKRSDEFHIYFDKTYGLSPDEYTSQDFWERVFNLRVPSY